MANIIYRYIANRIHARRPDSWVEVSSQPSSSSLSSAADDLINEGSRIQHGSRLHGRRRPRPGASLLQHAANPEFITGSSSQDEYEESESESDRAMSSSCEGLPHSSLRYEFRPTTAKQYSSTSSENLSAPEGELEQDAEDRGDIERVSDGATVIGNRPAEPYFIPQPNAFSHPTTAMPGVYMHQTLSTQGGTGRLVTRPLPQRNSYPSRNTYRQRQHQPHSASLPSHQADHDAALRASLSTLLSCAAAARGLPKARQSLPNRPEVPSRVTAGSLRLVPESVVLGTAGTTTTTLPPEAKYHTDMDNNVDMNYKVPVLRCHSTSPNSSQNLKESTKRKSSTNLNAAETRRQMPVRHRSNSKEKERESRFSKRPRRAAGTNTAAYDDTSVSAESLVSSVYSTNTSMSATSAASMEHTITPTLLTWVLSAGVVVLVSALSFSAGFTVGRESGHAELLSTSAGSRSGGGSGAGWGRLAAGAFDSATADPAAASCGRDAAWGRGFGLKRLRWTGAALGGAASVSV